MQRREEQHRHAKELAVVVLYDWFGEKKFRVEDLSGKQINELAAFLGLESNQTNILHRPHIEQWLSNKGEIDFASVPDGSVSVEVVKQGDGIKPGLYRIVKRMNSNRAGFI